MLMTYTIFGKRIRFYILTEESFLVEPEAKYYTTSWLCVFT